MENIALKPMGPNINTNQHDQQPQQQQQNNQRMLFNESVAR
jgi:hypothetical protein